MHPTKIRIEQVTEKSLQTELANIFREYSQSYRKDHSVSTEQSKVIGAIEVCKTKKLGGHLQQCNSCGYEHPVYNSCGNRHCPKCQALPKARWLVARKTELLPVSYFHNVFTLPHELNPLARCNKKVIYDILFASVSQTLQTFGKNPKNGLGGQMGFLAILHTWDQKLLEHIHLHCVIPAGALSFDKKQWIHTKYPDYLFPIEALSEVFRGKFVDALKKAFANGEFIFPGQCAKFETEKGFLNLIAELWKNDWVVYSKPPFAGPEQVLEYLGRYTHRIAISNNRIKSVKNGQVIFSYRDRRNNNQLKERSLPADEFIRRFLLHVLPDSYMKIRHFGFFSNSCRKKNIALCKQILGVADDLAKIPEQNIEELMLSLTGKDITKCPRCKTGKLITYRVIPRPQRE